MPEYILEAQQLSYKYPDGTRALKSINLRIEKGVRTAVVGSNGAGKSTLFLNLNGVLKPTEGTLLFKGREIRYNQTSLNELRKSVGIVFQDPDIQLFSASVQQDVSFGPMNLRLPESAVRVRVENALEAAGVGELRTRPVHFLSSGQKKRVSIAGVLAMEPEVIILDEPAASLDPLHSARVMELFDRLSTCGTTLILSTHDMDTAYSWAQQVVVMKDGRIIGQGTPCEIFSDNDLIADAGLAKPFVLEVYEELKKTGSIGENAPVPENRAGLLEILRNRHTGFKL